MKKPILCFDLDGTLIDSRRDIAFSLNLALKEEGFRPLKQEVIEGLVGWGAKQLVQDALGASGSKILERVFASFWRYYEEHLLDETRLYSGVEEVLHKLQDYPKGVITNKPELFSQKILDGLGLSSFFDFLIAADTLPVQKPDPETMAPLWTRFGPRLTGLMVGDSIVDLQFAKAAGLKSCVVTYGFGKKEDFKELKPDYWIDSFHELEALDFFTGGPHV
ncbi:MAG: HAD-IA family hydrolase [Deltaproteobacteria bacterium]|nr:HAD-IA family hydrolase [Deltaproteobacteria bacterium]